jgi:hypothetical protein
MTTAAMAAATAARGPIFLPERQRGQRDHHDERHRSRDQLHGRVPLSTQNSNRAASRHVKIC